MFISKSMRIFALSILLVPITSQASQEVFPTDKTMIAVGAYLGAFGGAACVPFRRLSNSPLRDLALFGAIGGFFGGLIGYFLYKENVSRNNEIEAENKQKEQGKKAAEHAASYAQIRNAQKAQKTAHQEQTRRAYNASSESKFYKQVMS